MPWKRGGLILSADSRPRREWALSHAQCPTPDRLSDDAVRVYFGARDATNRTRPTFVDLDSRQPERVLYQHDAPVLELGEAGCFDDAGVMPSCIVNSDGLKWLYYAGWNTSTTVPYRVSIGLAVSEDGGYSFRRLSQGPILDRSFDEPHFCSTPFVVRDSGDWKMWYLSCLGWRKLGATYEPQYHVKIARSRDGIRWQRDGSVAIPLCHADEAIARPWVIPAANRWQMWYCHRSLDGYRTDKRSSYRIGYAESSDCGETWERLDQLGGLGTSDAGWDCEMTAYPAVYEQNGNQILLYNGNGFGRGGFGYADREEAANGTCGVALDEPGRLRQQARVC
jgi:hypothetical protein